MKKVIIATLICVLSLTAFAACAKGGNENAQTASSDRSKVVGSSRSATGTDSEKAPQEASASSDKDIVSASEISVQSGDTGAISASADLSADQSAATSDGEGQQQDVSDYETRLLTALDGATVVDEAFIGYYRSLGEYDPEAEEVAGAKYAAPDGKGDGSKSSPYSIEDAFDELEAGDTLYLRGGSYALTQSDGLFLSVKGSPDKYVTIRNYPGEQPIITNPSTGKETYAIIFDPGASYIVLEGLEISDISSKYSGGVVVYGDGQNHVIIRNNYIHDIKTNSNNPETDSDAGANGILLLGEKTSPVSNFIIADNKIENNVTGWSESLSVAGNCEYIYVIGNELDNNTNIGIDFYGNAKYCKTPSLDQPRYCVAAFNKISRSRCGYADCAALYVDGARDCLLQYNVVTDSQFGIEIGSEERNDDYPVKNVVVRYNEVKNNDVVGIRVGGYESGSKTGYVTATEIYGNVFYNNAKNSPDSAEIVIAKCDGIAFYDNKIYSESNAVVGTDFTESVTKNVTFTGNVIYQSGRTSESCSSYIFGKDVVGISAFNAIFGENVYGEFEI